MNHSTLHHKKRERAMRKTLTTGLLLLALSCPALAGEMMTPPAPQPSPAPARAVQETADGATLKGEVPTPPGLSESLTQIMLELLAVLPAIL